MSKIIAIWGAPGSGKTIFTVKLARAIYDEYGGEIICIFTDAVTPALPVLFPNRKANELQSVGTVLSQTEITQDTVLKNLVTTSDSKNIGFLGFTDGENRYSYPEFPADKAAAFLDTTSSIADVVIVDCGSNLTDTLAFAAIGKADSIFKLCKPDLKTISFFSSQTPLYADIKYRIDEHHSVMNVTEQEIYMPTQEATQHFNCDKFVLPYTNEIKHQTMNGQFFDKVTNKAFNKTMRKIMYMGMGG